MKRLLSLIYLGCLWAQRDTQAQTVPPPLMPTPAVEPAVEPAPENWQELGPEQRLADLKRRRELPLQNELEKRGFKLGSAAFLRVMKESNELELWLRKDGAKTFELFKTYKIAFYSGELGPKTKEGDNQAPEGLYSVTRKSLNPLSRYHLSFNIGYPNAYDLAHHRTGGLIMIHGKDVSIGCFAMTDPIIEELYLVVDAALHAGQKQVPVHCYPFRMTVERLARAHTDNNPWAGFWDELHASWLAFERSHRPPSWSVKGGRYVVHP